MVNKTVDVVLTLAAAVSSLEVVVSSLGSSGVNKTTVVVFSLEVVVSSLEVDVSSVEMLPPKPALVVVPT